MAGTELGKAYVQIIPSAEGIKEKLKEILGDEAKGAGESSGKEYSSTFGDMLKANLVSGAVIGAFQTLASTAGNLIKDVVSNYAEFEQLTGGVETLFKESAGLVEEYAANAFQTAGLSANAYMETVTSFSASLLQSLGGDTEAAARAADQAITDMSDNANKMGTDMASIQNAYQGFAKANYTMLDNLKLGYGGTKSEMERLLADAERISGIHFNIDSFADVAEAIHVVQTEMGITGTTAKEAASTVEGSIGSMKAAWQNLITGMGDSNADMDTLIDNFVIAAQKAADNIIPVAETALTALGKLVDKLGPIVAEQMPGFIAEVTPILANALGQIFGNLLIQLPSLVGGLAEGIGNAIDAVIGVESKKWYIDEYGQLTYALDEAVTKTRYYGAAVAEGLGTAAAAGEKFAGTQEEVASSIRETVPALTEEEQAFQEATASIAEIGLAAYEAISSGGDLGEAYAKLSGEMSKIAGTGDPAIEAIVNQRLALLELAATMQDLSGEYPALASMAEAYGYSVQQTSQWLLENGLTAEEWANQVSGATDSVVNSFQTVGTDLGMSLDEMKNNLASNIEAYNNWNSNIQTLMAAAVASGSEGAVAFVQYMQDMGIGAADQVQAMMSDVEGNLADFGSLFEGAGGEAMEAVYNQITGANLGEAASTAGAEIPEGLATGVSGSQDVVSSAIEEVINAAVDKAAEVDFSSAGTTEMESLASGISDAIDTVTSAVEDVVNAAKDKADAIEFATVGTARMDDLASGISDGADGVGSEAESAVEGAKDRAGAVSFVDVGLNLARGIASGITAGTGFIQAAAISAVNAAKTAAKAAAVIESPSHVWRDEIGVMLTTGMAAGMVTSEALSALDDAAEKLAQEGVDRAKTVVQAWEKVYDSYYDTQEHNLFMMKRHGATNTDIINWYKAMQQAVHEQKEHYLALGVEANSRYIMDLEEQWWEYQDEIDDLYEEMGVAAGKTAKKIEEDFQKAYNEIMKAQEQMASKLASFDLWTTDKNGNSILADPREQIRLLQEYDRALEDMSKYVGDDLMNEILGMSTQQVVDYWHQLQQFGGEELNRYLTAYNKSIEMAQDIAEKYYANDVAALTEQYNKDMSSLQTEEYAQAQTAALTQITEQNAESISVLNRIADSIQDGTKAIQKEAVDTPVAVFTTNGLNPEMAETMAVAFEDLLESLLEPIMNGTGGIVVDGITTRLANAQAAATTSAPAERDDEMVSALGTMAQDVVNGIGALMETHMNQGESELTVQLGSGQVLAQILLPYLIATARSNGTPIVNG